MTSVDLTVRGGGIFGLSVAWEAASRGARVRLIERERVGAGASGGLVGAMSPHTPEGWNPVKAFQLASLLRAESWWQAVEDVSNLPSTYARTGRLQPLADEAAVALAHTRATQSQALWQGHGTWQVINATGADWEPATPTGLLIHDNLTARINPRPALASLERALRIKGVKIVLGDGPDEGRVIWATGTAGLDALIQDLGRKAGQGVKGQAVAVYLPGYATQPQLFIDGLHIVPHADGTIAIGSTTENHWTDLATDAQADAPARQSPRRPAHPARRPRSRPLGRPSPARPQPWPVDRRLARSPRPLHRQWWLQDRLRHRPGNRPPDLRSGAGRTQYYPARVPTNLNSLKIKENRSPISQIA